MSGAKVRALAAAVALVGFGCGQASESSPESPPASAASAAVETPPAADPPAPEPPSPEAVAEAYLRAASDEARARALLDPACATNPGAVRVDAARMMGVPITIEQLTVTPGERGEDTATVRYEVSGPVHGEGGTTEMFGMQVETGRVDMDGASTQGELRLRRIDGEWKVGC